MILRIKVEVLDNATEPPLTEREIQIEAAPDILFVPGISQAAQSVVGKALVEAKKEIERRELAEYVKDGKKSAFGSD